MTDKRCCEYDNKVLCESLVGLYCKARYDEVGYIRITPENLKLLEKVGCWSFKERR